MRFTKTKKGPYSLDVGEKTQIISSGRFSGLKMRRSKKGYQIGDEGMWGVVFLNISDMPDREIKEIRDRKGTI